MNNSQIYYQVNNQIFYNHLLAHHESYKSGQPVEFYCFDNEYDRLDWTKEPEQSFDELMTAHAYYLRNKYDILVLQWSGGTDSHTIYNIFKRNGIHIDEIRIQYDDRGYEPHFPESHVHWMIKNHPDPTTCISTYKRIDNMEKKTLVNNEDWIFQNKGFCFKFALEQFGDENELYLADKYSGKNYAVVAGFEKPFVHFKDGRWYTRQTSKILGMVAGHNHVECFFLNPLIHLKQSHMAKNALKKFKESGITNSQFIDPRRNNFHNTSIEYRAWSKIVGRHSEINDGISFMQKKYNSSCYATQINFDQHDLVSESDVIEKSIKDFVSADNEIAKKYVKGLYNVHAETGFVDYMNQNCWERKDEVFSTRETWSKDYDLGI